MPEQNETQEFDNNDSQRIFTRILQAATPYLNVFDRDDENHIARGLLVTPSGAHTAVLAYDAVQKALMLAVVLRTNGDWTMPRLMILLRLQNDTAVGSSSISLDAESSVLRVRSHALLPSPNVVPTVVAAALKDTVNVLEDSDFRTFVN